MQERNRAIELPLSSRRTSDGKVNSTQGVAVLALGFLRETSKQYDRQADHGARETATRCAVERSPTIEHSAPHTRLVAAWVLAPSHRRSAPKNNH
jgi:hypothetical protein